MKTKIHFIVATLALLALVFPAAAEGTAFTYQGRLGEAGAPANGNYDLRFHLFDMDAGASLPIGGMTNENVAVLNGLFTVTLDFGAAPFDGSARWLEIGVRTNGSGTFTTLSPRQPITATPYAITAANLSGVVSSGGIAGAYSNAVTFNNPANEFTGSFIGNGVALSNVNAMTLGGLSSSRFWKLGGNSGTTPGTDFLGTSDSQPFELKVANDRVFRFEPAFEVPNVIGGSRSNVVTPGIRGATIAGGGLPLYRHTISADYGAIGGGTFHIVSGPWGTIGGGRDNRVHAESSTIAGGYANNIASNSWVAFIGGGYANLISTNVNGPVIGGGSDNRIGPAAHFSTISGGTGSRIGSNSYWAVIGGGGANIISNYATRATISGGSFNMIEPEAHAATIGGGDDHRIEANTLWGTIGGGVWNRVLSNISAATISGGFSNVVADDYGTVGGGKFNRASGKESTVAGGAFNNARAFSSTIGGGGGHRVEGTWSVIAGGRDNIISSNGNYTTIAGGRGNVIESNLVGSTIGGGSFNRITVTNSYSTIGGGIGNIISNSPSDVGHGFGTIGGGYYNENHGWSATIAGGYLNKVLGFGDFIGGGFDNSVSNENASVVGGAGNSVSSYGAFIGGGAINTSRTHTAYSVIGGGERNEIQLYANNSFIGGGYSNTVVESAQYAVIPGGDRNSAGAYAFAAGHRAKATHLGSFAWADATQADFPSTAPNQFSVRASGGARFVTSGAGMTLDGQPVLAGTVSSSQIADGAALSELLDDDGPGSGLNADLLDGMNSTAFAAAAHNHYGEFWSGNANKGLTIATTNTGSGVAAIEGREGNGVTFSYSVPTGIWGNSRDGFGVLATSSNETAIVAYSVQAAGMQAWGTDGVRGYSTRTNGGGWGVYGRAESVSGVGVRGDALSFSGFTYGVYGDANSPDGTGVYGKHDAAAGTGPGVEGETESGSPNAVGVLGRVIRTAPGSFSAGVRGINNGTGGTGIGVYGSQAGSGYGVYGTSVGGRGVYGFASGVGVGVFAESETGNIIEGWSSTSGRRFLVANDGNVRADGTFMSPAADFAELLPASEGLEPGDVLIVDDDGQLMRSTEAAQENVVGVYSTKPAFLGGADENGDHTGKVPLAVIGVVPVKVTNENGAIKPGNLLVTSSTPGHAMKAGVDRRVGTIIGKALAPFNGTSGVIQILVVLQ